MQKLVIFFVLIVIVSFIFANSNNSYMLNDFVVRSLKSSMYLDPYSRFSLGFGYKRFSVEDYLLSSFSANFVHEKTFSFRGNFSVILPLSSLEKMQQDFDRWWNYLWLDAWFCISWY